MLSKVVRCVVILTTVFLPVAAQQPYPPQQQYPQQQYPQQQYPQQPYPQQYPQQQPQYGQYPQYPQQAPPPYTGNAPIFAPEQLENLVSRIALYPDQLLAEVLTASTYPDQIVAAATWANNHRYLTGDALARAMAADQLNFEPNVMALIPFPAVLDTMARDMGWTQQLGSAVLAQRPDVMDAVQRMRQRAYDYGYLRSGPYERVVYAPGMIQVLPVNPGYYYVPYYNPAVVFYRPARGIAVGGVINWGPSIYVGAAFAPYGWVGPAIDWRARTVIIDNRPWARTWVNRTQYVHPWVNRPTYVERGRPAPYVERHERENRDHFEHDRGRRDERR
jgi:hypothetical protein